MKKLSNLKIFLFIALIFIISHSLYAQQNEEYDMYYIDGYHGGWEMCGDCKKSWLRALFTELDEFPEWKVSLEVESETYELYKSYDPLSYERLYKHLQDTSSSARIEIWANSYNQPYCWTIDGESNIRNLIMGKERVQELFPGVKAVSYAVQEPCFTSALPQILNQLGFRQACMMDAGTLWTGYQSGIDKEVVLWEGPDGSTIPCVPSYGSEKHINSGITEALFDTPEYVKKYKDLGIDHVLGKWIQDVGMTVHPHLYAWNMSHNSRFTPRTLQTNLKHVTLKEFFNDVLPEPEYHFKFTQENIHPSSPWGSQVIDNLSAWIRENEKNLLMAEKLSTMASVLAGKPLFENDMVDAWKSATIAQHHDAYVCARPTQSRAFSLPEEDRMAGGWYWKAGAASWNSDRKSKTVQMRAKMLISQTGQHMKGSEQEVTVFNTLAWPRQEIVSLDVPVDRNTFDIIVTDMDGNEVPSQFNMRGDYYYDGSLREVELIFEAKVPSMGYSNYKIISLQKESKRKNLFSVIQDDENFLQIENEIYRIRFNRKRGGTIESFYSKKLKKEFCDDSLEGYNYFKGYFTKESKWRSSADSLSEISLLENGPVRAKILVTGKIADTHFNTFYTFFIDNPRVDVSANFNFPEKTFIGAPKEEEFSRELVKKPMYNEKMKLQAFLPVDLSDGKIFKDAAFDIYQSTLKDTHYETSDDRKMNLLLHWADIYSASENVGMSVFTDKLTAYSYGPDYPFTLTVAYGGFTGYYTGTVYLEGDKTVRYSFYPHQGNCYDAGIWERSREVNEPLTSQLHLPNSSMKSSYSFLEFEGDAPDVTAMYVKDDDVLVRFFNPYDETKKYTLKCDIPAKEVDEVSPDGSDKFNDLRGIENINFSLHGKGIKTFKFSKVF